MSLTVSINGIQQITFPTGVSSASCSGDTLTITLSGGGGSSIDLQTNGVDNATQSQLNIAASSSSSVTVANSGGTVTITGPLFQTNSSSNATQSQLNLVAGSNVTLVNSGGNVTISASGGGGGGSTVPFMKYDGAEGTSNDISGSGVLTQNSIFICPMEIMFDLASMTNLVAAINHDATNHYDVGIYDTSGNLIASWGPKTITGGGSVQNPISQGTTNFAHGSYIFAVTTDAASPASVWMKRETAGSGIKLYTTSTTSSGGALPSTITLATSLTQNFTYRPMLVIK